MANSNRRSCINVYLCSKWSVIIMSKTLSITRQRSEMLEDTVVVEI